MSSHQVVALCARSSSPFERLSPEIRNMIYELVVVSAEPISTIKMIMGGDEELFPSMSAQIRSFMESTIMESWMTERSRRYLVPSAAAPLPAITRVSRTVRQEALSTYYAQNTFRIDIEKCMRRLDDFGRPNGRSSALSWVDSSEKQFLPCIQSIVVVFSRERLSSWLKRKPYAQVDLSVELRRGKGGARHSISLKTNKGLSVSWGNEWCSLMEAGLGMLEVFDGSTLASAVAVLETIVMQRARASRALFSVHSIYQFDGTEPILISAFRSAARTRNGAKKLTLSGRNVAVVLGSRSLAHSRTRSFHRGPALMIDRYTGERISLLLNESHGSGGVWESRSTNKREERRRTKTWESVSST
ncbi:hypothetical protein K402DRAFT_216453 [Aulographum hederae CBS 113979]|uniref:2EXR domain-containing protein n=1 Tax=Aulographum hederae CBS 113979 TaxID=1176131 RepID=A0A6G1GM06_9PEZI|nr:hypothetical protein K402DRAFT_216453 [Aulographum hederae CBS 113979]